MDDQQENDSNKGNQNVLKPLLLFVGVAVVTFIIASILFRIF